MANWLGSWRVEGALRTSGVGEEDGGDGGAPVGDLDGEIPVLELVHPDHLPALRIGTAEGRGDGDAAQREEQRGSIHHLPTTRGTPQECVATRARAAAFVRGRRRRGEGLLLLPLDWWSGRVSVGLVRGYTTSVPKSFIFDFLISTLIAHLI
jgi:hypothetical protein